MITTHFAYIPASIKTLETHGLALNASIQVMKKIRLMNSSLPKLFPSKLKEKFENVLKNNPGFEPLCQIDNFINGAGEILPGTISSRIAPEFKFCPATSVDVERSFSAYKNILSDRRHNLSTEHLEQYLVIYVFKGKF